MRTAKISGSQFQSTSSVWRTTGGAVLGLHQGGISIHVLRVEDDCQLAPAAENPPDFNPRPPCGGRLMGTAPSATLLIFQSTSSVWRTTHCLWYAHHGRAISIHVLRVEDDLRHDSIRLQQLYFNPRPPCGGRPIVRASGPPFCRFQSTSSVWRTTLHPPEGNVSRSDFNPRPPCGGRQQKQRKISICIHIIQ